MQENENIIEDKLAVVRALLNLEKVLMTQQDFEEKTRILDEIKEKLSELEIIFRAKGNTSEKISKLSTFKILTDEDWEKFKNLFEQIHKGFFFKLKNEIPGITNSELRLSALIKLNLNSHEIAQMTGISTESVKKTRQRLRQKMELKSSESLDDRIKSIF
jgi:DNA-binding CsgD family transcriptional regulator